MTDYMCPADPTVTHCYHAAKVNEIIRAHVSEITRLTARVAELEGALTPSAETKAAYIGEFHFTEYYMDEDGNDAWRKITVPWDTVKEIMAAIRARAALTKGESRGWNTKHRMIGLTSHTSSSPCRRRPAMTDIVERLRKGIEWTGPTQDDTGQTENYMDEAADEIERLREWNREIALNAREFVAENEKLRKDLSMSVFSDSEYCKVLEGEQERLLKSRNRWAQKYNSLLNEKRAEDGYDVYAAAREEYRKKIAEQAAEVERLRSALRGSYEVYAGSDGFIPATAAEGYQQQIIKQMVDCISAALEEK